MMRSTSFVPFEAFVTMPFAETLHVGSPTMSVPHQRTVAALVARRFQVDSAPVHAGRMFCLSALLVGMLSTAKHVVQAGLGEREGELAALVPVRVAAVGAREEEDGRRRDREDGRVASATGSAKPRSQPQVG